MGKYSREELADTLSVISSFISRCEKAQLKFAAGTSQYTLLKNRIKALYISKSLVMNTNCHYRQEELIEALPPVSSIISKCEKAQLRFAAGSSQYKRFANIINAMSMSKALITEEISKMI